MKNRFFLATISFLLLTSLIQAQNTRPEPPAAPKVAIAGYDGIVVAGYVDGGAYLNFTGPNIHLKYKHSKFILGMLPSLRFKEDNSQSTRNAIVTPNLGVGFTYCYQHLALQVPLYYNAKTATSNGAWVLGVGLGWSFKK